MPIFMYLIFFVYLDTNQICHYIRSEMNDKSIIINDKSIIIIIMYAAYSRNVCMRRHVFALIWDLNLHARLPSAQDQNKCRGSFSEEVMQPSIMLASRITNTYI